MDIIKSIVVWLIGIIIILFFFPITFLAWLIALPFDRNRVVVHWLLVYQGLIISYLVPIWKINIEGREKAVPGTTYVIICNHQSILDILIVNCLRYRYKWISKIEVTTVPILGWYLKMADYLIVDRGDKDSKEKMMGEAYECLKKEISIMIFPEGTRSADNEIAFFKRGAFVLALSTKKPILPVILDGTGGVLPKHGLIFGGFHNIKIRVLDPVQPEDFGTDDYEVLSAKFQDMYKSELQKMREQSGTR
jgi:1-acyl-sn-glycerol-3-phosphate acyltransferase